ncbi:MAG: YqaE/Pmp3 family membrane protein [Anaerolineae bacterium]|nr:YqaE/Pmp3 family membrane protein [Anaerolineae bacterium]
MLYLLAILIPPLAVLLCGKPLQALFNLFLTLLLWIPGMLHALFVVHGHYADKRNERAIKAMQKATAAQTEALLEAQKHADQ